MLTVAGLVLLGLIGGAFGHGYMLDPPARSSMWRLKFDTPKNYNDMSINCGGYDHEYFRIIEKGKCGVCGDPYDQPQPRENEAGGKYGLGVIAKRYQQGQDIHIAIVVTGNDKGFFEFRICKNDDIKKIVTQDCLDKNVLELKNANGTRYYLNPTKTGLVEMTAKLPTGLTCSQCVLQWKWHAGNNYGRYNQTYSCMGCGNQMEFYGCSDVAIGPSVGQPQTSGPLVTAPDTHTLPPTQGPLSYQPSVTQRNLAKYGKFSTCHSRKNWEGFDQLNIWCVENCFKGSCPQELCQCPDVSVSVLASTMSPPIVHFPPSTPSVYIPPSTKAPLVVNVPPSTKAPPVVYVRPSTKAPPVVYVNPTTRSPTGVDVTTGRPSGTNKPWVHVDPTRATGHGSFDTCHGVGLWGIGMPALDNWCVENCALGNCPSIQCACPDRP